MPEHNYVGLQVKERQDGMPMDFGVRPISRPKIENLGLKFHMNKKFLVFNFI